MNKQQQQLCGKMAVACGGVANMLPVPRIAFVSVSDRKTLMLSASAITRANYTSTLIPPPPPEKLKRHTNSTRPPRSVRPAPGASASECGAAWFTHTALPSQKFHRLSIALQRDDSVCGARSEVPISKRESCVQNETVKTWCKGRG
jgi:hypothetical protein